MISTDVIIGTTRTTSFFCFSVSMFLYSTRYVVYEARASPPRPSKK